MKANVETRAVLAAAYLPTRERKSMLTHAVVVDRDRNPLAVLCRRVSLDNLADRYASDPTAPPTCPVCARKAAKA